MFTSSWKLGLHVHAHVILSSCSGKRWPPHLISQSRDDLAAQREEGKWTSRTAHTSSSLRSLSEENSTGALEIPWVGWNQSIPCTLLGATQASRHVGHECVRKSRVRSLPRVCLNSGLRPVPAVPEPLSGAFTRQPIPMLNARGPAREASGTCRRGEKEGGLTPTPPA